MRLSIHRTFVSHIENWWWFAFAVLLSLLVVGVSFIGEIVQNADYTLPQRLRVSIMIIGLLALWGLALQKPILEQDFWRLFFFFSLMVYVLLMVPENRYELPSLWRVISYVIFVTIHVPCYMGMCIYGFCSKQIWKLPQDERIAPYIKFPHYKWVRRTKWFKKWLGFLKLSAAVVLIILCLTFIPLIIRNNRVLYRQGNPPEFYERMLKYRRTTIPQLHEFERLFPDYLW